MRTLVIQAISRVLNPSLSQEAIDSAIASDPESGGSEWLARWRADISGYLDDILLDRAIVPGRRSLPFCVDTTYVAFCDPSGGRGDAMTLGIAHQENGRAVLDKLLIQPAPFDPGEVTTRFCEVLSAYGLSTVTGDQYSGEWVTSAFMQHGVTYQPSELSASEIYSETLPLFTENYVELLDHLQLRTELALLERRARPGGRGDLIDHPQRAHDDAAIAACGALLLAARTPTFTTQSYAMSRPARTDFDPYSSQREEEPINYTRRSRTGL